MRPADVGYFRFDVRALLALVTSCALLATLIRFPVVTIGAVFFTLPCLILLLWVSIPRGQSASRWHVWFLVFLIQVVICSAIGIVGFAVWPA